MLSLEVKIVNILEKKLLSIRSSSQGDLYEEFGRQILINKIKAFIQENQPIELLLPAFPCKSPNLEKVSGKLPDAGELYALEHLNEICREISFLYEYGCHIRVWSDGRVFGDLIGVPSDDIAMYERLLKYYSMTMTHIDWDSMNNYIDTRNGETLVEKYGSKDFLFDQWMLKSEDNRQQFSQIRKFMESDAKNLQENKCLSRRQLKEKMNFITEEMIRRNEALTNLLKQHYPNHIRLSIHQHINDGQKFTIRLFNNLTSSSDQPCMLRTPWHNVLVIQIDGSFSLIPYRKLNLKQEHIPIKFKNQIWCFVQLPKTDISELFASTVEISCLDHSPRFGLLIDLNKQINVSQLNVDWMKMLLQKFGIVILRQGQNSLDKENYSQFCEQFGLPVMWKFGSLLSIKPVLKPESGHASRELLPLHFDLSYPPDYLRKTGFYNDYVPQHLMLYCVQAPHEDHGGKTTFVNGRLFLESLQDKEILKWKTMKITSVTSPSYFGGQPYTYPIIMTHPKTNENILRYCQRSNTVSQPVQSYGSINDTKINSTEFEALNHRIEKKMCDPNWYYEHTWNNDDLVIAENHLLLHGRTPINENSDRELWRIQTY